MNSLPSALEDASELYVRQSHELAELFGFETRNKYAITTPDRTQVAFAAEQQKGILGFLLRQFLGHWRPFEIHFMGPDRRGAAAWVSCSPTRTTSASASRAGSPGRSGH